MQVIVKSSADSSVIAGANVVLYNANTGESVSRTFSGNDGIAKFDNISAGNFYSRISAQGFNEVPQGDEGYLTKMRSKIVSREHLNELGKELNLIDLVESKIPKSNFGNNIHGNLFEALVGAIFLDRGYAYCEKFIYSRVIIPHVDIAKLEGKVISYKSLLIEWCQKEKKTFDYHVYEDTGNDTLRHFSVKLSIDGKVIAKARATSKKKAEEKASKRAFFAFQSEISKAF
ncbi:MAG: ribonuclease III [Bacteroidetes bacterium]|nr:ribonuclease III [Bacteroidota bacterium]